jgi:hypothetical protein
MLGSQSHLIEGLQRGVARNRLNAVAFNPLIVRNDDPVVDTNDTSCFAPVCGVSIEQFAEIAKAVAAHDDNAANGSELAGEFGISPDDWLLASRIWNSRIATYPAVAGHLMALFRPGDETEWLAS